MQRILWIYLTFHPSTTLISSFPVVTKAQRLYKILNNITEQSLASIDGVLEKLDTKIKETNKETERITDIQTTKENQSVEGDLNNAKDAIKVHLIKQRVLTFVTCAFKGII